jgi:hypothetical protein
MCLDDGGQVEGVILNYLLHSLKYLYNIICLDEGVRVDGVILDSPMHSPKYAISKVSIYIHCIQK